MNQLINSSEIVMTKNEYNEWVRLSGLVTAGDYPGIKLEVVVNVLKEGTLDCLDILYPHHEEVGTICIE